MRTYFCLFMFQAMQLAAQSTFVSLGRSKHAVFFSLLRKAFINAPLAVLLPVLGLGTGGVFMAEPISHLIGGLASLLTMYFVVYRPMAQMKDLNSGDL